jgi:hypothetical protein
LGCYSKEDPGRSEKERTGFTKKIAVLKTFSTVEMEN